MAASVKQPRIGKKIQTVTQHDNTPGSNQGAKTWNKVHFC